MDHVCYPSIALFRRGEAQGLERALDDLVHPVDVERVEGERERRVACLVRHGATPFIESPVTKDEDWAQCERLLAAAAKRVDESGKL